MSSGSDAVSALDAIGAAVGVRLSVHETFGIVTRNTSVLGELSVNMMALVRWRFEVG